MKQKRNSTLLVAVIGGMLTILIFVFGTLWTDRNAGSDTEAAVRSVSLLYLDELAGRREQVVESNLQSKINDIRVAMALMDENDLSILSASGPIRPACVSCTGWRSSPSWTEAD